VIVLSIHLGLLNIVSLLVLVPRKIENQSD